MILEKIAKRTVERVAELKREKSEEQVISEAKALDSDTAFPFEEALRAEGLSFICEVKKRLLPRELLLKIFPIYRLPRTMRRQELRRFLC